MQVATPLQARLARALAPRYAIERELGRGGMGVVFLGRDTVLERPVAVKGLLPELATAIAVERFLREARTLARLSHPRVVQVHDVLEPDGLPCFVMDYLEGPTLRDLLREGRRLPAEQVRTIGLQVLDALEYMHRLGIVHRDLKPGNIFLVDGGVKLVDFGIASHADGDTITPEGQQLGTRDYMAPEQRSGGPLDGRADLYALGLVLLEALTGRRASAAVDARVWREVPPPIARVLQRAIAADPAERWQDAAAFRDALARATARWTRQTVGTLGLAVVGLAALVAFLLSDPWQPAEPPGDEGGLAILPFRSEADSMLGQRLSDMVTEELEPFPLMRVAPVSAVAWSRRQRTRATAGAEPSDAGRYVEGHVRLPGDSLRVEVTVRDAADGALFSRFSLLVPAGDTGDLGRLAHQVADSLVRKLSAGDLQDFRNLGYRPVDVQAAHAFFEGKAAFRQGDWNAAAEQFETALQLDPRYLDAAWNLMITRRFQRLPFDDVLAVLQRDRDALAPFYRELLDAQLDPDLERRIGRLEALVRSSSGSGEAWLHYTNELFHRGALVGRPLVATLDTMSALAERRREMRQAATYDLAIWGNLRIGREDSAWRQFRRRQAIVPPGDERGFFQRFAIWSRFSPWKAGLVRTLLLRRLKESQSRELDNVVRLGLSMDVPDQQAALGRLLARNTLSRSAHETGMLGRALALMALGRPGESVALFDTAAAHMATGEMRLQALEWPVALAALGLPVDTARVARARAALATATWTDAASARARFTLGLDALARDDTAVARALADTLAVGTEPVSTRLGELLGALVRGRQGDPEGALAASRAVFLLDSASYHMGPFARSAIHLARGEWQQALGRWAEADREWLWYENADYLGWPVGPPQAGEVDALLSGLARVRRAELGAERLDREWACEQLDRVTTIWRTSEASWSVLTRRVADDRERLGCR
jgi:tetratricopeptide (TPR) repeat protein